MRATRNGLLYHCLCVCWSRPWVTQKRIKPTEVPSAMWAQRNYFLGWSPLRIPQTHCSTATSSVKRCLKSHLWSSTVAAQTRTGNGTRKLNLLGVCRIYPAVSSLHEKKPWLAATAAAAESSTVSSLWIYASARSLSFSVHRLYRPRWYRYCHSLLGIWQRRFLKKIFDTVNRFAVCIVS